MRTPTVFFALGALLVTTLGMTSGCSKHHCQEGSNAAEDVKGAPIEAEFKPYLLEGAAACGPSDDQGWKVQRFSYDMEEEALKSKLADKHKGLQRVECPSHLSHYDVCFADGNKRLAARIYRSEGTVLTLNYREISADELGATCMAAEAAMKGEGDFVSKLTKLIAKCGEACDVEHQGSCKALDKGMSAICGVNKSVCGKLCSTLQSKSSKALACKLAK